MTGNWTNLMSRPNEFEYIAGHYGVPAKRGARVRYTGDGKPRDGSILSSNGAHVFVRFDDNGKREGPFHPTWEMAWLENGKVPAEGCDECHERLRNEGGSLYCTHANGPVKRVGV